MSDRLPEGWLSRQWQRGRHWGGQRWVRRGITAVFLLLTLAIIGSVIFSNRETLRDYPWQIRPAWLLVTFISLSAALLWGGYVWHQLVTRFVPPPRPGLRQNLKFWAYANLAKRLPGPIWYIGSRALMYEDVGVSKLTTSLLSGLELAIILLSGLICFLLLLPFWALPAALSSQLTQSWLLLPILLLCLALLHPAVLTYLWRRLSREPLTEPIRWRQTALWIGAYVLIWLIGSITFLSVIQLLFPLPAAALIPAVGIWITANLISLAGTLAISGMGLRELSLTLLLTLLMPAPIALMVAILVRIIWLTGEFAGGLLSLTL